MNNIENKLDIILAEISAGELIDKITILEIKKVKISDKSQLADVEKELFSLNQTVKKLYASSFQSRAYHYNNLSRAMETLKYENDAVVSVKYLLDLPF